MPHKLAPFFSQSRNKCTFNSTFCAGIIHQNDLFPTFLPSLLPFILVFSLPHKLVPFFLTVNKVVQTNIYKSTFRAGVIHQNDLLQQVFWGAVVGGGGSTEEGGPVLIVEGHDHRRRGEGRQIQLVLAPEGMVCILY